MEEYKGTARTIGILFIVATVAAIVGGSLVALPLEESNYLVEVADKDAQVITGALLLMVQTMAVIGIAVMFFPVLKRRNEGLALGFVGARTIEGVLTLAGAVAALSVLTLSRDYGQTGAAGDVGIHIASFTSPDSPAARSPAQPSPSVVLLASRFARSRVRSRARDAGRYAVPRIVCGARCVPRSARCCAPQTGQIFGSMTKAHPSLLSFGMRGSHG